MTERSVVTMPKWPFVLIDLLFLGLASWIIYSRSGPLNHALDSLPLILCVAGGAGFLVYPFIMDYQAALKLTESDNLVTAVQQIQNLETVAGQISTATGHWQSALDQSNKTVAAAHEIAERMTQEAKSFAEFMQKANDAEKGHLRLEVDKLRRAEGDWLKIIVGILDHVYGLYMAGVRSGQPNIIAQLGTFQNACRDVARRVGLVPYVVNPGEAFDPERHQLLDEAGQAAASGPIADTVATGYTFQGQLLRKAIVVLQAPAGVISSTSTGTTQAPSDDATEQQLL